MKKLLLLTILFTVGCFPTLGSRYYNDDVETQRRLQQGTTKRVSTEYSPPISVSINVTGDGKIEGAAIKDIINGVKDITDSKNILNTDVKDKVNSQSELAESKTTMVKESILITAIGCLILFVVIVMAVRWFKATAIGQAVSAGMHSFSRLVQRELKNIDDELANATDPAKINSLLQKKARLAQDELDYRTKK